MTMIHKLLTVLPPPMPEHVVAPAPEEWKKFAEALGHKVPFDYTLFARIYGFGSISHLLRVYLPLNSADYLEFARGLIKTTKRQIRSEWDAEDRGRFPYRFFSDNLGLFPFAVSNDMDILWWNLSKTNRHPIIVTARDLSRPPQIYRLGLISFLYKALMSKVNIGGWTFPDATKHPPTFLPGE